MKTKRRIRRLIKELRELESANRDGKMAGIALLGAPDMQKHLGALEWNSKAGVGS
jgi:hypothetical protein